MGDVAHGVLFACGGISVGAVSIGGVAFGAVSLGGVALGAISVGGLALGYSSLGGVALALDTARGGIALAFEYALGPISIANHVTDDAAREHFSNGPWLGATRALLGNGRAILVLGVVASIAFGLAQRRIKSSPPTDVGT